MHQPRPYGLFGKLSSDEDAAAVDRLVQILTNIKQTGDLASLKLVRALPGGGVAVATDMGGVLKVVVSGTEPPVTPAPDEFDGYAKLNIPVFFSGVITKAVIQSNSGKGVEMRLTETCRRRVSGYPEDNTGLVSEYQALQRFVIPYSEKHKEFEPEDPGMWTYTQYAKLRPTWFTGAMAQVVQLAGGYGRQDDSLPKTIPERAVMKVPQAVMTKIAEQLGKKLLPGYTGVPPASGEIQFDYKFQSTNGISFDSDRKPWLVRVSSSGVYAMPLPMVPATAVPAFKKFIETVADDEVLKLLELFGGMPSGEGFPAQTKDFEAWRRAGVIIKVCNAGEFYSHLGYSTTVGWAFNSAGSEAVNTCYSFGDDGIQRGYLFSLSLSLGEIQDSKQDLTILSEEDQQKLNAYLSALLKGMGNDSKYLPTKFKLKRVSAAALIARAGISVDPVVQTELEYWDNFEAEPIANHKGSVTQSGVGNLWAPGKPKTHPQIKFPEPAIDGCLSHDFSPLEGASVPNDGVLCDTAMFAYFVEDELKTVKYFRDHRTYKAETEDNYDDCMIIGSWERTETIGSTSLLGNFYLTDIDDRKAAAPITTVTKTVGTDLGYDTKPYFAFDHFFSMVGTLSRSRYFQHKVNKTESSGFSMMLGVCAPFFHRNAFFHAVKESTSSIIDSESLGVYGVGDPNSYRFYTYHFVWAWVGGSTTGNAGYAPHVSPGANDGKPVWVVGYNYYPGPCTDFADQGDWLGGLPQDYTWLIHPKSNEWNQSGGGGAPTVKEYSRSSAPRTETKGSVKVSILRNPETASTDPALGYFTASPNDFGDVFYQDAISNVLGEAVYSSCGEAESPGIRKHWGYTRMADHKAAHHFIGVING